MNELFGSSEDFINSFDKYEDENEDEFYKGIALEDFEDFEDNMNYDTIGGSLY